MDDFKIILEGWRNHLFPPRKLKAFIGEVSESRLQICLGCDFNSTKGKITVLSHCTNCGCPLIQKSKALHAECPVKKWLQVATPEESDKIANEINETTDES